MENLNNISPVMLVLYSTLFTWGVTALGAAVVFLFKKFNRDILDGMLGFAAGVMIAATIWSLIIPAIDLCIKLEINTIIFLTLGFVAGCVLLLIFDNLLDDVLLVDNNNSLKRVFLLISSITLHNIPEGLAIGVVFGSVFHNINGASLSSAIALAIGIGIQNFPEGAAVSLPLHREGYSKRKAFYYGQLSGMVEPLAGLFGYFVTIKMQYLLPFFLAFAAGAMLFVVVIELIPASQNNKKSDIMTLYTMFGFLIMMLLDISLG
jgi:ZIP family zinc transporter